MRQLCVLHRMQIIAKILPLCRLLIHGVYHHSSQKQYCRFCVSYSKDVPVHTGSLNITIVAGSLVGLNIS